MIKKIWLSFFAFSVFNVTLAQQSFVVSDIKVTGLERISAGAIFNYLNMKVGDTFNQADSADLLRSLYKTGFFEEIELVVQGSTLILQVEEYPAIASIEFTGNKKIKDEVLLDALTDSGFVEGRVFKPNILEQVGHELKRQYLNQGKYNAQVGTEVKELERNRVAVTLHVKEGPTAKVKKINIIGNEFFSDKLLKKQFESRTDKQTFWFWSSKDQYSKEKVSGDLESLRSFYQDQGFLDFRIISNQVSISPEKDGIFITINLQEGERYTVSQFVLNGRLIVSEVDLLPLVSIAPGRTYSRKDVDDTIEAISDRLAEEGYSYAKIVPVPDVDAENNTVGFSINVKPGRRVYVRRIDITGNRLTNDDVIRRELRQTEGSAFSPSKVNRSKIRLQRLSYFDEVEIETVPVAGREDQVDLEIMVDERATGSFQLGVGYSGDDGALIQTSLAQANLFGRGNQLNFGIQRSDIVESINLQFTNPYYTKSGISRTLSLSSRSIDSSSSRANTSEYLTDTIGLSVSYLFPINEHNSFSLGAGFEKIDLETTRFSVPEVVDFIENFPENDLFKITAAFAHDTRDSLLYPTSGISHRLSLEASVPGSDLEYYKLNLDSSVYFPLTQKAAFKLGLGLGYGDGFGDADILPFFKNYFAGGSSSVRGYEARSLGPRDSSTVPDPFGGSKRILFNASLLLPVGDGGLDKRLSLFIDGGQVFADEESFDVSEVRFTAGIGFNWVSPVGPLSISYATPLNEEEGDETEGFQFSVGRLLQ